MKCEYCIWKEQCEEMTNLDCDNFTAADDSQEVEAYEADLAERHALYMDLVKEF